MKKWILGIACLAGACMLNAQIPASKFREVSDTVIARYNRGDYKEIYAMTNQTYKDLNTEDELAGGLNYHKTNFGKVISSELTDDLGDMKFYKWTCEKGNMCFELGLAGNGVNLFKFNDFTWQPAALTRHAQTDNPLRTAIDSIVDRYASIYMSDPKAVGFSIGIYKDGKKYTYNYGEMEKGSGKPVTDQTIFTVGSITKTFTGVLLCRAVLEKKVRFDDDIRKYLDGSFPNLEYQGKPVTLLSLASHTSGIRKFRFNILPGDADKWTDSHWMQYFEDYSWDSLYRDLHALKVDTMPGTQYNYSLIGTVLLNIMLEKVYHASIDQIIRDYYGRVFHMKDAKLASDAGDVPRYSTGYGENGRLMPRMWAYTPSLSTVHSTTRDMLNYVEANVLEKDAAIRLSHKQTWGDPKSFAVGIPWDLEEDYGHYFMIWHSGYDYGSTTLCTIYPSLGMGMFLWANDDTRQNNLYDMERAIRAHLLHLDAQMKK